MTKLEKERRKRHLSKAKLADMAGVSDNTILRIETEYKPWNVQLSSFTKLAKAMNLHTFDVIDDEWVV